MEISRGRGVSKANICKRKYQAKLEITEGRGIQMKPVNLSVPLNQYSMLLSQAGDKMLNQQSYLLAFLSRFLYNLPLPIYAPRWRKTVRQKYMHLVKKTLQGLKLECTYVHV